MGETTCRQPFSFPSHPCCPSPPPCNRIYYLLEMGSSESQQKIAIFESDYLKQPRTGHPFFGTHTLLANRNEREMVICKQLIFQSSAEYRQFLEEYDKIERKPFNIIYPRLLMKSGGLSTCSHVYQINAYFDLIGRNLTQIVKSQGCLNESKAWFLLNQISKSLQIMSQSYRPHWAISPENIYQNSYQNYFIFDSFFVLGYDPQSFLMSRLENNDLMSEKMRHLLEKGMTVTPAEGFEDDCYCLGFVLLFAVSGVHCNSLPKDYLQRSQAVRNILSERRSALSAEMVEIILLLTEREALRRMDNYQLRRLLKDKEAEIIRNEEHEYEKSRKRDTQTPRDREQPLQKLNLSRPIQPMTSHHPCQKNNPQNDFHPSFPNHNQTHNMFRAQQPPHTPVYKMYTSQSFTEAQKYTQANHHISHFVDYPSDRSNALTRINSYDRLIPKK